MKAVWHGETIAESDETTEADGYRYFPRASVRDDVLIDSPTKKSRGWMGEAAFYSIIVEGHVLEDAAFYYPEPTPAAADQVADRIAFHKEVEVIGE